MADGAVYLGPEGGAGPEGVEALLDEIGESKVCDAVLQQVVEA